MQQRIGKDLNNIPDVQSVVYKTERSIRRNGNGKIVKVNINVGRKHKIAPNFILGALVDATGMSGKNFGKLIFMINILLLRFLMPKAVYHRFYE